MFDPHRTASVPGSPAIVASGMLSTTALSGGSSLASAMLKPPHELYAHLVAELGWSQGDTRRLLNLGNFICACRFEQTHCLMLYRSLVVRYMNLSLHVDGGKDLDPGVLQVLAYIAMRLEMNTCLLYPGTIVDVDSRVRNDLVNLAGVQLQKLWGEPDGKRTEVDMTFMNFLRDAGYDDSSVSSGADSRQPDLLDAVA